MTRPFRLEEDERRYFALRSEFFIRLVQSGVPAQTVHEILRNFGKLEDVMFFEGVRQGVVAALLADDDQRELCAIALHGDTYGSASTPLTRVEDQVVSEEYALFKDHPWLDQQPMLFGPLTLTEAQEQLGPDLGVTGAPPRPRAAPAPTDPVTSPGMTDLMTPPDDPFDPFEALERLANGEDPDVVLGRPPADVGSDAGRELQPLIEVPPDSDEPLQRPALLDNVRDILGRLDAPPQNWQDLILMLMRETRHDAGFLDDLLSTPMGMTVISQAKLFHLHPGAMPEIKPAVAARMSAADVPHETE